MDTLTQNRIEIRRTIEAPREKVFAAWGDPKLLKKWFAFSEKASVEIAELNFRQGGRFAVNFKEKGGERNLTGVWYQVDAPDALVMTWTWEGEHDYDHNRVEVRLSDADGATELLLTHGYFAGKDELEKQAQGWNDCLDRLAKLF